MGWNQVDYQSINGWYRPKPAGTVWSQGIYFRATNNQVSPSGYDAEIATTANYPRTSAQGNSVGWDSIPAGINTADRDVTTDVRLKGIAFVINSSVADYRITLPAPGTYNVRCAMGDSGFGHPQRFRVQDNGSVIWDKQATTPQDQWMDANGTIRTTESDWVNNNTAVSLTFATTVAQFLIGGATGGTDNSTLNTIFISQ